MDYGYLTLVAPILTLAVAIATRKVPLAMLVGIFTGQLIICGWNPFTAINESVNGILSVCADTGNLKTFLFTALMGAFVILVRISGGVKGFVNYLTEQSKRVKSPRDGDAHRLCDRHHHFYRRSAQYHVHRRGDPPADR